MKKFVLASNSPRRHEILTEVGIEHVVRASNADENISKKISPEKYVMELALLKGASAAQSAKKDEIIISADTVVVFENEILGKPKDFLDAMNMLLKLAGNWHSVLTGFCVIDANSGNSCVKYEETKVKFVDFGPEEAKKYIRRGESMDKAGSYGIQGKGRLLVEKIEGDYFNVVGLPVCALRKMLKEEFGIDIL